MEKPVIDVGRFRRRFFLGSISLVLILMIIVQLWILDILMKAPVVESPDQQDIEIVEEWLGVPFPQGSTLQKLQFYWSFTDQTATVIMDIPSGRLEAFVEGLPGCYVLDSREPEYIEYNNMEESWPSFIRIYKPKEGKNVLMFERCMEGRMYGLFLKYLHEGRYTPGNYWPITV